MTKKDEEEDNPIAIVGLGGVFPDAPNPEAFWQNIRQKVNSSRLVPEDRWIIPPNLVYREGYSPDHAYSKKACLIDDFTFDPRGLDIDESLVRDLDPLYHLTLEAGRQAWEEAVTSHLNHERVGVILAAIALPTDSSSALTRKILGESWRFLLPGDQKKSRIPTLSRTECFNSHVTGFPAALLAKALQLQGGSYTLDAACASSLYSLKLACDELKAGRLDAVLAGGVSRPECLYTQVGFSQLHALSPSGSCSPFDKNADGLVVGEGAGVFLLKRLQDAIQDNDHIYGVIQGIGLSNDIGGNLLAPDSEGQLRAMQSAYEQAGWEPQDVDLVECHGTGTPMGDQRELESLYMLWQEGVWREKQCAIGSVKSMVGHLLTGAGAAGMMKVLLALKNKTLPPTANYKSAAKDGVLQSGPFYVQTEPETWKQRKANVPRKAAISAFGFGGINAHVLLEEWSPAFRKAKKNPSISSISTKTSPSSINTKTSNSKKTFPSVAIVGMGVHVGKFSNLESFQEAIFEGKSSISSPPPQRWKGVNSAVAQIFQKHPLPGAYLDNWEIPLGKFRLPPNEIPEILPQQLIMLEVAAAAMEDARIDLREKKIRTGTVIGMAFDMESTNFHLRWNLDNEKDFLREKAPHLTEEELTIWIEKLREGLGPALNATRTQGALGGIIASRVAKELLLGGPSFVVSSEEASGLRALEIALRALQQNEVDSMLVGAVDLPGEIRSSLVYRQLLSFSGQGKVSPFSKGGEGTALGEGAVALVLKRLDQAQADNDRIYATIEGVGYSGGGEMKVSSWKENTERSLQRVFREAPFDPSSVSYLETHGSGIRKQDEEEAQTLESFFSKSKHCAIGSSKPIIGHTGAVSGLASLVKTSLCLYQQMLPPLVNFKELANENLWSKEGFHLPQKAQFWYRDRSEGPRRAGVSCLSVDGASAYVVLEGRENPPPEEEALPLKRGKYTLFPLSGNTTEELLQKLQKLEETLDSKVEISDISEISENWFASSVLSSEDTLGLAIVGAEKSEIQNAVQEAFTSLTQFPDKEIKGKGGIFYSPKPLFPQGKVAFVYPGSGSQYVAMGQGIGCYWPDVLRDMDAETARLQSQLLPQDFIPWRKNWPSRWQQETHKKLAMSPEEVIFGQVTHGCLMTNLIRSFDIQPQAAIGYSLGESAALFALGAWPERGNMLERIEVSPLFKSQLAGKCSCARDVWKVPSGEEVDWEVALISGQVEEVKKKIASFKTVRLLIVNTPDECVIGGRKVDLEAAIEASFPHALYLGGIVTVHCEVVVPVQKEYRDLHLFPVTPPSGIDFYSNTFGGKYELTREKAADSILGQALHGFDYTRTIREAYKNGVRIFLEMGPNNSCTRMIRKILQGKDHFAQSACVRGEDESLTIHKFLGACFAQRIPLNLSSLFPKRKEPKKSFSRSVLVEVAGSMIEVPSSFVPAPAVPAVPVPAQEKTVSAVLPVLPVLERVLPEVSSLAEETPIFQEDSFPMNENFSRPTSPSAHEGENSSPQESIPEKTPIISEFAAQLLGPLEETVQATAQAHQRFLDLAEQTNNAMAQSYTQQMQLLQTMMNTGTSPFTNVVAPATLSEATLETANPEETLPFPINSPTETFFPQIPEEVAFPRDMCMEFAIGSLAKVLGEQFAIVDTYPIRVRLPDEPLMLVDRIISVQGEKASMTGGRVVTEHDVFPGAWYLDGNRAPVCITVEAGQADLFLCSYLGIDLIAKGKRAYRLLDATIHFHRGLPQPHETVRYDIKIDKFINQGDVYLFFFNYVGKIGDTPLITMEGGCAGFFTKEENEKSGGIIFAPGERDLEQGKKPADWRDLVPMKVESYEEESVLALRQGNLEKAFGPLFQGKILSEPYCLPQGRMELFDRILKIDPKGGRYQIGLIQTEADMDPEAWFLTCHFVDDQVMPGTLMYECCAHTIRTFLLRMGWVGQEDDIAYEPVPEVKCALRCRGPVTAKTKKIVYEIEFKEIGYRPEPYIIADAFIYGDGKRIVSLGNMSMQMTNSSRAQVEAEWESSALAPETVSLLPGKITQSPAIFTPEQIMAYAVGNPSEGFGDKYKIFDQGRILARLPGPPYLFLDRVTSLKDEPWVLKASDWIEGEYDLPEDAWFFEANRQTLMPFCILLEIALQPCGWLAAYLGSALRSESDLSFRNLGGKATLREYIHRQSGTLTIRVRMTDVSEAGGMLIEKFDMQVLAGGRLLYEGNTYFGFFSKGALANQVGIRDAGGRMYQMKEEDWIEAQQDQLPDQAPFYPEEPYQGEIGGMQMPGRALRMVDKITAFLPEGGPHQLGFIRGTKKVNPEEWFFKAHFYQDPVCPGSLGLESFLQLLKHVAIYRFGEEFGASHQFETIVLGEPHEWIYRGQIIPTDDTVTVEAVITEIRETPHPTIKANGFLSVDGRIIYEMRDFGLRLLPL